MQLKFHSEYAAIEAAKKINGIVQIVESNGEFFVEDENDSSIIRNWERLVYSGEGKKVKHVDRRATHA